MSHTAADKHKAENEVIFKRYNQRIQKGFDEIKRVAKEDGQEGLIPDHDGISLHFICECSDENCRQRILLKPSEYSDLHKQRHRFVIKPGHETERIEKVMQRGPEYSVVEKVLLPPVTSASLSALNTTDAKNA